MNEMLTRQGLRDALQQTGEAMYHHRHPFHLRMHAGELTREQLQAWALNRFYYQSIIPIKDAIILSKSYDAAFRLAWRKRIVDHDGDPAQPEKPGGIEKWIQLAQQHSANRSYAHAREALQNALALRPKDVRASRLLKEVEREEQDYLRLRKEKAELYQSAVNAWQNGEVSQALSHMRLVLDLDRQAPDASSPETANAYQSFYNKIRSSTTP